MVLPTNVDSTYADSGTDASVALHQQHHDTVHGAVNALAGGSTGQVLSKTSGTDYAMSWQYRSIGPQMRTGWYYGPQGVSGTVTPAEAEMRMAPLVLTRPMTIDRIGVEVTSAGTTGAVVRLGIYSDTSGLPDARLLDAGTVSGTVVAFAEVTVSITLDPGVYWLVAAAQGGASTRPTLRSVTGYVPGLGNSLGTQATAAGVAQGSISGSFPANASSVTTGAGPVRVLVRAA